MSIIKDERGKTTFCCRCKLSIAFHFPCCNVFFLCRSNIEGILHVMRLNARSTSQTTSSREISSLTMFEKRPCPKNKHFSRGQIFSFLNVPLWYTRVENSNLWMLREYQETLLIFHVILSLLVNQPPTVRITTDGYVRSKCLLPIFPQLSTLWYRVA